MQHYSLIALSMSAVLAVSLVDSPAQAESTPAQAVESQTPSEIRQRRLAEVRQQRLVESRRLAQATPQPEASPAAPERPTPPASPAAEESAPLPAPSSTPPATPAAPAPLTTPAVPTESAPLPTPENLLPPPPSDRPTVPAPAAGAPAPENLNPSPNPLNFPTKPEEVQVRESQGITLQQAIELAVRNSPSLQQTRLELEQSRFALREAEAANAPTLDATAGLQGQFTDSPVPEATNALGQTVGGGRDSSSSLDLSGPSLDANYRLFTSGQRSANIRAAEETVRFRELAVEVDTKQLVLDVSTDYYDLQEADRQVEIFQAALNEALQSLRDAQALERAGVGTRFDVLQSEVDAANARQDLTQQLSQQEIARRTLAQRLSLAQGTDITAADEVAVAGSWDLSLEESVVAAYKNRAELEQQLAQRDIGEQRRRVALSQLGPQIGIRAQTGLSNRLLSSEDGQGGNGFTFSSSVALNASLRLFDGGEARAQARQQETNIAIAESQFVSARDTVRFQVEQAYATLQASAENIETTALAVQRAREALRLARLRFQAGVGTQTDVIQQQTALTRSQVNNLRAILDYNRSLAQLQRSVSNLPEGNLSETP